MALNFMQWNGRHGCTHCLDEGTHVRVYLPNDSHTARTEKQVLKDAASASSSSPVSGVKGESVLSPYLNIVKDTAIDYMHAVLEGVTKRMLHKFWLNGKYSGYRFYLKQEVEKMDEILLRIRPPHEFRRTPRSLNTLSYWKASEFRAWLLQFQFCLSFFMLIIYTTCEINAHPLEFTYQLQ